MTGRIVRSCLLYALLAFALGLIPTAFIHHFEDTQAWQPDEPQWASLIVVYGLTGFALRYLHIEVFSQSMRVFHALPATAFNTSYKSAMFAKAALLIMPLLIYKLFVVDLQLLALSRFEAFPGIRTTFGRDLFNNQLPACFGNYPYNFYLLVLLAGAAGAAWGFVKRADERHQYMFVVLFVMVPVSALLAATVTFLGGTMMLVVLFGDISASAGIHTFPGVFKGMPSASLLLVVGEGLPLLAAIGAAIGAAYEQLSPAQRAAARAEIYMPTKTFGERLIDLYQTGAKIKMTLWNMLEVIGTLLVLVVAPWVFLAIANAATGGIDWSWSNAWLYIAAAVNVGGLMYMGSRLIKTWLMLFPPSEDIDPGKTRPRAPEPPDNDRDLG